MIWKPHTTVAAIIERNGQFLMIEEISDGKTVINQPAGHLNDGESLFDAVIRESLEETGWQIAPTHIIGIYQWKEPHRQDRQAGEQRTFIRVCYAATALKQVTDSLDEGIIRALWMTLEEIEQQQDRLRSPLVLPCIRDYLANVHYPLSLLTDINSQ